MLTKLDTASYEELLNYLFSLKGSYGLENVLHMAELLDHPQNRYKTVHVGGSNGKGSVSTKTAKALEKEGFKCGLYTSPHILCYRERIQINGEKIPEADCERLLRSLLSLNIARSFFEITTLLAFCWFAEQKVDWAVIEVGLGGRLDATNIIHPEICFITSISLEHTEILGSTLAAIAKEKAGIIKGKTPVIVGCRVEKELIKGDNIHYVDGVYDSYDEENSASAKKGLKLLGISDASIEYGLKFRPPCRAEWIEDKTLIDVAHNPEGIQQMLKLLQGKKAHFLLAFSKNKDAKTAIEAIVPHALSFILTESSHHPCIEVEELRRYIPSSCGVILERDPAKATLLAKEVQKENLLVITGTFYIMKEAKAVLMSS